MTQDIAKYQKQKDEQVIRDLLTVFKRLREGKNLLKKNSANANEIKELYITAGPKTVSVINMALCAIEKRRSFVAKSFMTEAVCVNKEEVEKLIKELLYLKQKGVWHL